MHRGRRQSLGDLTGIHGGAGENVGKTYEGSKFGFSASLSSSAGHTNDVDTEQSDCRTRVSEHLFGNLFVLLVKSSALQLPTAIAIVLVIFQALQLLSFALHPLFSWSNAVDGVVFDITGITSFLSYHMYSSAGVFWISLVLLVVSFLLLDITLIYTTHTTSVIFFRAVRASVAFVGSVLYIPLLGVFIAAVQCKVGFPVGQHDASLCWGTASQGIVSGQVVSVDGLDRVIAILGILMVFGIVLLGAISHSLLYEDSPISKHALNYAQPQSHTSLNFMLIKTFLVILIRVLAPLMHQRLTAAFVAAALCYNFYIHLIYLPWYSFLLTQVHLSLYAWTAWAGICGFVSSLIADESDDGTAIIFYLITPIVLASGVLAARARRLHIEQAPATTFASPYEVELRARFFLEPITSLATDPHATEVDIMLPEHQPFLRKVNGWFVTATKYHPQSVPLLILYAQFALYYLRDTNLLLKLLQHAHELHPNIDEQFKLFKFQQLTRHIYEENQYEEQRAKALAAQTRKVERARSNNGSSAAQQQNLISSALTQAAQKKRIRDLAINLALEKHTADALHIEELSTRAQIQFWLELQKTTPELEVLSSVASEITRYTERANYHAYKILKMRKVLSKSVAVEEQLKATVNFGVGLTNDDGSAHPGESFGFEDNKSSVSWFEGPDTASSEYNNPEPTSVATLPTIATEVESLPNSPKLTSSTITAFGNAALLTKHDPVMSRTALSVMSGAKSQVSMRFVQHAHGASGTLLIRLGTTSMLDSNAIRYRSNMLSDPSSNLQNGVQIIQGRSPLELDTSSAASLLAILSEHFRLDNGDVVSLALAATHAYTTSNRWRHDNSRHGGRRPDAPDFVSLFKIEEADQGFLSTFGYQKSDLIPVETGAFETSTSKMDQSPTVMLPDLFPEPFRQDQIELLKKFTIASIAALSELSHSQGSQGMNPLQSVLSKGLRVQPDVESADNQGKLLGQMDTNRSAIPFTERLLQVYSHLYLLGQHFDGSIFPFVFSARPVRHPTSPSAFVYSFDTLTITNRQHYILTNSKGGIVSCTPHTLSLFDPQAALKISSMSSKELRGAVSRAVSGKRIEDWLPGFNRIRGGSYSNLGMPLIIPLRSTLDDEPTSSQPVRKILMVRVWAAPATNRLSGPLVPMAQQDHSIAVYSNMSGKDGQSMPNSTVQSRLAARRSSLPSLPAIMSNTPGGPSGVYLPPELAAMRGIPTRDSMFVASLAPSGSLAALSPVLAPSLVLTPLRTTNLYAAPCELATPQDPDSLFKLETRVTRARELSKPAHPRGSKSHEGSFSTTSGSSSSRSSTSAAGLVRAEIHRPSTLIIQAPRSPNATNEAIPATPFATVDGEPKSPTVRSPAVRTLSLAPEQSSVLQTQNQTTVGEQRTLSAHDLESLTTLNAEESGMTIFFEIVRVLSINRTPPRVVSPTSSSAPHNQESDAKGGKPLLGVGSPPMRDLTSASLELGIDKVQPEPLEIDVDAEHDDDEEDEEADFDDDEIIHGMTGIKIIRPPTGSAESATLVVPPAPFPGTFEQLDTDANEAVLGTQTDPPSLSINSTAPVVRIHDTSFTDAESVANIQDANGEVSGFALFQPATQAGLSILQDSRRSTTKVGSATPRKSLTQPQNRATSPTTFTFHMSPTKQSSNTPPKDENHPLARFDLDQDEPRLLAALNAEDSLVDRSTGAIIARIHSAATSRRGQARESTLDPMAAPLVAHLDLISHGFQYEDFDELLEHEVPNFCPQARSGNDENMMTPYGMNDTHSAKTAEGDQLSRYIPFKSIIPVGNMRSNVTNTSLTSQSTRMVKGSEQGSERKSVTWTSSVGSTRVKPVSTDHDAHEDQSSQLHSSVDIDDHSDSEDDDAWIIGEEEQFSTTPESRYNRLVRWREAQDKQQQRRRERAYEAKQRVLDRLNRTAKAMGRDGHSAGGSTAVTVLKNLEDDTTDLTNQLRAHIAVENRMSQRTTRRFQMAFICTILLVTLLGFAQFISQYVQVTGFYSNLKILQSAASRADSVARSGYAAQYLNAMHAGWAPTPNYSGWSQPTLTDVQKNMYSLASILLESQSALNSADAKGSASSFESQTISIYDPLSGSASATSFTTAVSAFAARVRDISSLALASISPAHASVGYVLANAASAFFDAMIESTRRLANDIQGLADRSDQWALALFIVSIVLMILAIIFIIRPTVMAIQENKSKILNIFTGIPIAPIRRIHALTNLRLAVLTGDLHAIKDAQSEALAAAKRDLSEQLPRIAQSETGTALTSTLGIGKTGEEDESQTVASVSLSFIARTSLVFIASLVFYICLYIAVYEPIKETMSGAATTAYYHSLQSAYTSQLFFEISTLYSNDATTLAPNLVTVTAARTHLTRLEEVTDALIQNGAPYNGMSLYEATSRLIISKDLRDLWFGQSCSLIFPSETAVPTTPGVVVDEYGSPTVVGPFSFQDYFAVPHSVCSGYHSGSLSTGLQTGIQDFIRQAHGFLDAYTAPSPQIVWPTDWVFYDNYWRLLQAMQLNSIRYYVATVGRSVDYFVLVSVVAFAVYCAVVVLLYYFIYHPLIIETHVSLKSTRAMLFLIPAEILANIPVFRQWLRAKKKDEAAR